MTEEQLAFLADWYLSSTKSQVEEFNGLLPDGIRIVGCQQNSDGLMFVDGDDFNALADETTLLLRSSYLTDEVTYGPIISALRDLDFVNIPAPVAP